MSHGRSAGLLFAILMTATAAGQQPGTGPAVTMTANATTVQAGSRVTIAALAIPAADAPGPVSMLLDSVATPADGFVHRSYSTSVIDQEGRLVRCLAPQQCAETDVTLDVRTSPGRLTFPVTVTDARGRATRTSISLQVLAPRDDDADGMPDAWEFFYGLREPYGPRNDGPDGDADGDGVKNRDEFAAGTNPNARASYYFAEGSSGDRGLGLHQCFYVAPFSGVTGHAWVTTVGDDGRRSVQHLEYLRASSAACPLYPVYRAADRVVAVLVEGDAPFAVERRAAVGEMFQPPPSSHLIAANAMTTPSARWLFADGGTDGPLDTFFLAYNPQAGPVDATFTFHLPNGQVASRRTVAMAPGRRTTVWMNADEPRLGRVEASVEVTATAPILLERAWRFDPPGRTVTQVWSTPGTDDASSRWFFPHVDGAAAHETTVVLSNPDDRPATADVNLLFADRREVRAGRVSIPAHGRVALPARQMAALGGASAAVEVVSANGVRIAGERTFSGQDRDGAWRQAAIGARAPGTRWTIPNVGSQGPQDVVLVNTSSFAATVELDFIAPPPYFDSDASVKTTIVIPARQRVVYPVAPADPKFPSSRGVLRVTSQNTGSGRAELVVEEMSYENIDGVPRVRASGVMATRIE